MTMVPDYVEQKGSLTLRSDHMNYSRAIKNSNWHQARESEPKDYDISKSDVRDLCKTTYNRIGNITDGSIPITTYQDMGEQVKLKREFSEQEPRQAMINENTAAMIKLHRTGHNAVLPEHNPDHNKLHLETTHLTDYKPPYPYESAEEKAKKARENGELDADDPAQYTPAYKYCLSQFTDTTNHRRSGWNTWQDESGVYSNSHFKAEAPVYQRTKPIANRLK